MKKQFLISLILFLSMLLPKSIYAQVKLTAPVCNNLPFFLGFLCNPFVNLFTPSNQLSTPIANFRPFEIKTTIVQYLPIGGVSSYYPGAEVLDPVRFTKDIFLPALGEASKYHGYKDRNAQPSLIFSLDESQTKTDNFFPPRKWNPESNSYGFDYSIIFAKYDLCNLAKKNDIRMVIVWAAGDGPYAGGMWESAVTGNKGIPTNGAVLTGSQYCNDKTILILGLNYGRGLADALESYGHHLEAVFRKFRPEYQEWSDESKPKNGNLQGRGDSCGIDHNPVNARYEYDADGADYLPSDCRNWDPENKAAKEELNCQAWGCAECNSLSEWERFTCARRKWLTWWMQNMPGLSNGLQDKNSNPIPNWWVLVGDPDNCYNNQLSCSGYASVADSPVKLNLSSNSPETCYQHSGNIGACNDAGCSYYVCSNNCLPRGTPLSIGCNKNSPPPFVEAISRICQPKNIQTHQSLDCINSLEQICLSGDYDYSEIPACLLNYRPIQAAPGQFNLFNITQQCSVSNKPQILLQWDSALGAVEYKVYHKEIDQKTGKAQPWELVGETNELQLVDENIKPNFKYVYLVNAYSFEGGNFVTTANISNQWADGILISQYEARKCQKVEQLSKDIINQFQGTQNLNSFVDCSQYNKNVNECDAHFQNCSYFLCSDLCLPKGTPLEIGCKTTEIIAEPESIILPTDDSVQFARRVEILNAWCAAYLGSSTIKADQCVGFADKQCGDPSLVDEGTFTDCVIKIGAEMQNPLSNIPEEQPATEERTLDRATIDCPGFGEQNLYFADGTLVEDPHFSIPPEQDQLVCLLKEYYSDGSEERESVVYTNRELSAETIQTRPEEIGDSCNSPGSYKRECINPGTDDCVYRFWQCGDDLRYGPEGSEKNCDQAPIECQSSQEAQVDQPAVNQERSQDNGDGTYSVFPVDGLVKRYRFSDHLEVKARCRSDNQIVILPSTGGEEPGTYCPDLGQGQDRCEIYDENGYQDARCIE